MSNDKSDTDDCDAYLYKIMGLAETSLSGASRDLMRVQLFDTLDEFFDNSNCWQESISLTVIPNTLDYQLQPVTGRILRLNGVYDQNRVNQAAAMPNIGEVHFLYPYTDPQLMTVVVVKTVTDPLKCYPPHVPDWLLPAHGRAIMHGIVGNIMIQPGESYSNPTIGNFHLRRFRDLIAHARVAAMRANTVGSQAWAFPQAYRTRSQRGGVSTYNVFPTPR